LIFHRAVLARIGPQRGERRESDGRADVDDARRKGEERAYRVAQLFLAGEARGRFREFDCDRGGSQTAPVISVGAILVIDLYGANTRFALTKHRRGRLCFMKGKGAANRALSIGN
jgi:hypothetical protein